ncbi:type II toxin-antitoxin system RelE/ParE family toxin [Rufibacter immobilis]|uniref:type II toxin-antitoxin system RelE/ParE family toxin n=1 Tax=Rufibacter immobilis TaxID=1348778 RepID=UPI0035EC803B
MQKPLQLEFMEDAEDFLDNLPDKDRDKFLTYFELVESGQMGTWFKKLSGQENLWEFRVKSYRLFAFYSEQEDSLVICTHGFVKKQQRTPLKELKKAQSLKRTYHEDGS